jgi:hypothetical protein
MSCTDGKNTYINIKELPEINDVIAGDYLIVETSSGTSIINYENFLVTLDNTTFSDVITNNTTNIIALSTQVKTLSSNSATISQLSSLNTSVQTLCNNTATSSQFNTLNSIVANLTSTTTDTYAVFSLSGYNTNGPKLLKGSNIYSVTYSSPLSCVKVTFTKRFTDSFYGYTSSSLLSTVVGPISAIDFDTDYINVYIKDKSYNFTTTDRATIRIVGGQVA